MSGEQSFVLPPPLPGNWVELPDPARALLLARLRECRFGFIEPTDGSLARVLPLDFWKGWMLCDVQPARKAPMPDMLRGATADGAPVEAPAPGIHSFLYGPDGFSPLDGSSGVIHHHNGLHPLDLSTVELQHAYLRFFCYFVRGELGPFEIVEERGRLRGLEALGERVAIRELTRVTEDGATRDDGTTTHDASIVYGENLFTSRFALRRDGMIEMLDDDPLGGGISVVPQVRFEGTARIPVAKAEPRS